MNTVDNDRAREAWNTNASFWDERMADGNDFFTELIWPAVEKLLKPKAGERLLDVACGNGVTSRRLGRAGAHVVAVDFAEDMIERAKRRGADGDVEYRVLDATDQGALSTLGDSRFDGALCNMALMDIAEIGPLMAGIRSVVAPTGQRDSTGARRTVEADRAIVVPHLLASHQLMWMEEQDVGTSHDRSEHGTGNSLRRVRTGACR